MADDNNQNNNQQNQGKQKGGGGGGGNGLSLSAKFDAGACPNVESLKKSAVDGVSNAAGMIVGTIVAGITVLFLRNLCGVKDAPAQGGGGGQIHPGQITGALFNLKKSDPDKFAEIVGKVNPPAA